MLDAALMHLNEGARIAVCGQMSQYFSDDADPAPGVRNLYQLVIRNVRMQGYVPNEMWAPRFPAIFAELAAADEGAITHRAHVVEGFESVPEALGLLQTGGNRGKLIVQTGPDPWADRVNRAVVIERAARDVGDIAAALTIEHRDVPELRDGEVEAPHDLHSRSTPRRRRGCAWRRRTCRSARATC